MKVLIIPINEVDRKTTEAIAEVVRVIFACEIEIGRSIAVPVRTYNPVRKQFSSIRILKALELKTQDRGESLLGIIDLDLYVPELNFVFGQADVLSHAAVIALPRLRQEFYGLEPDAELFLQRAAKEAVHELGHVNRLDHCPQPRCVMHFSNSLQDTDLKELKFCEGCRNALRAFILTNDRRRSYGT